MALDSFNMVVLRYKQEINEIRNCPSGAFVLVNRLADSIKEIVVVVISKLGCTGGTLQIHKTVIDNQVVAHCRYGDRRKDREEEKKPEQLSLE